METYEYDYLGNRTAKTSGGVTTEYTTDLSSGYSQVLKAEIGTTTVYYTRGFELISRREGAIASYYVYDGALSVRALTNEAGTVTDTLVFDAFGNETGRTRTTDNPYGFQGEEQDATGLYYLRARYMDPATGTFTTMDTYGGSLSDPMSLHKYLFANSNPVMYSDPSGHSSLQELGASMAISSILAGACYSSCVIVAAILDASTGSNRLSKYSISGLVYSMLVGFMMGGIAFELGAIFASLGLSFLQYLLISIVCAVIGIGLKYAGDRLKQSDYTGIGIVVSTLGDVGLVAAFAAALSALSTNNNGQKGKNYDQQNCTNTSNSGGRYSGELEKVNKPDPAADALAERIGGKSSVKFSNDPAGREFDVVSDRYIGQAKPALKSYGEGWRNQTKATFEAAKATNRIPYFQFEGNPDPSVIDKIAEYGQRYGIPYVIDTNPLGVTN